MAVTVLALATSACRSDRTDTAVPTATVRTELPAAITTTIATTTTIDPFAVPAVIDVAYVNRVLAGLDALTGEAFRLYMRDRRITAEISARLKAAYGSGELYELKASAFELDKETRIIAEPGNPISATTRLVTGRPGCIYAKVSRDYRPAGGSVTDLWVGLRQPALRQDPSRYNPTSWMYVIEGVRPDRSEPPNPCAGS